MALCVNATFGQLNEGFSLVAGLDVIELKFALVQVKEREMWIFIRNNAFCCVYVRVSMWSCAFAWCLPMISVFACARAGPLVCEYLMQVGVKLYKCFA